MYKMSEAFQNAVQQDSRTFLADIRQDGTSLGLTIRNLKYTAGCNAGDSITLGSTIAAMVEFTVYGNDARLQGKEVAAYLGLDIGGTPEMAPLGFFTCQKPVVDEEDVTITAYDRMIKFEKPYFSSLSFPASSTDVLQELCTEAGVPFVAPSRSVNISENPAGYTCREMLGYVAQLLGGYAIIDRTGSLVIRWYQSYSYEIHDNRYWAPFERAEDNYTLGKLVCIIGKQEGDNPQDKTLTTGVTTASGITFSNPFMTQNILDLAFRQCGNISFRPGSFDAAGDPQIEPGDMVTIYEGETSYVVPVMSLEMEWDGGLWMHIEGYGEPESESGVDYQGPNTQAIERLATELLLANRIMANKIDAETVAANYVTANTFSGFQADFELLSSDYANFNAAVTGNLSAIEADITTLRSTDLAASNARIGDLEADYAALHSVLMGNAAGTDAQFIHLNATNAVIDSAMLRTALINVLTVNDLAAGNISTDRFTVGSDDGSFLISGSRMQIFDIGEEGTEPQVRIQIGKDASEAFSFALFDAAGNALWYEDGITGNAIPDNIIVDDMVAPASSGYSGIGANKLNINDLWDVMNADGSHTWNSARISMDGTGQTLSQVYTSITESITTVSGTASSAEAAARAAQADAANSAANAAAMRAAIEGISTLDAFGVMLSNDAHVVHTYSDGSGGDYSNAETTITAMLGDTDVSSHTVFSVYPSSEVTGTWNASTRTYQVSGLSGMNGYVDFEASYGIVNRFLVLPDGKELVFPDDKIFAIPAGSAIVTKRFSISKAPDGRIGLSYKLLASTQAIRKQSDGTTLLPASVTFSAVYNEDSVVLPYTGIYVIEESTDGSTFTEKYRSASAEVSKVYTPSSVNVKQIWCTLYNLTGTMLDQQSVIVLADAEGLADDIDTVRESVQTVSTRVGTVESGIEGLRVNLAETAEELHTVTDGNLRWEPFSTPGESSDLFTARLLDAKGENITRNYPDRFYTYYRRTEDERVQLGYGYTFTVNHDTMGYGGVIQAIFTLYEELPVTMPNNLALLLPNSKVLAMYNNYE